MPLLSRPGLTLAITLASALLLASCASQKAPLQAPPTRVSTGSLPKMASQKADLDDPAQSALVAAINGYRRSKGLALLADDRTLDRVAAVHSADMALRGFFGHYNPDGQGPRERVLALVPDSQSMIGENVLTVQGKAYAVMSPDDLAKALLARWIASPPHRKNIEDPGYSSSGVGLARLGEQVWATQVFAGR